MIGTDCIDSYQSNYHTIAPACSLIVFLVQKAMKYSLISTSIDIRLAFSEHPLSILEYSLCKAIPSFSNIAANYQGLSGNVYVIASMKC
jgi:hypothetical protein